MSDPLKSPGRLRWLISCDESGVGGAPFYGFGSLWMRWQRRGDFVAGIRVLREEHDYWDEIKWQKAHGKRHLTFYLDLVDYFFRRRWLVFHCLCVRKGLVDKALHREGYDEAMRKHYTMLLTNKMRRCARAHPGRDVSFRIYVDPIKSRYPKADEAMLVIANNVLARELRQLNLVESVVTRDSKETPSIQLCDLLLGAVMEARQQRSRSEGKRAVQEHIAAHLGWDDLAADTYPKERKFNIWQFHDPTRGPREARTRPVPRRRVALVEEVPFQ